MRTALDFSPNLDGRYRQELKGQPYAELWLAAFEALINSGQPRPLAELISLDADLIRLVHREKYKRRFDVLQKSISIENLKIA